MVLEWVVEEGRQLGQALWEESRRLHEDLLATLEVTMAGLRRVRIPTIYGLNVEDMVMDLEGIIRETAGILRNNHRVIG